MKKLLVLIAFAVTAVSAKAGVLFEPFVGYTSGTSKTGNAGATSSTNSGALYGAVLGYKFGGGWWLGADYTGGTIKSSGTTDSDLERTTTYVDVGYDFSNRVRLMAGYGVSDKSVLKGTTSATDLTFTGTSFKAGIGYMVRPMFSVGLVYISHSFTDLAIGTAASSALSSSSLKSIDDTETMFVVSFPFGGGK